MKSIIISFFFSVLLLVSCKNNKQAVPENVASLTQVDALSTVSELYDTYQQSEDYLIKGIFYPANFLAQDMQLWGDAGKAYNTFNVSPNDTSLNNFWVISYNGIIKANTALVKLDEMAAKNIISKELASRLKSEVLFNRGVFYFYLASNFGNVPILSEKNYQGKIKEPNSTQMSVFEYVAKDLEKAQTNLPFSYEDKADIGRATKGAALAYLGETFMWLKQYDNAIKTFEKLNEHYQLMSDYLDIHSFKHQNNKESIFEIQFNGNDNLGWGRDNYSTFIQSFSLPNEVGGTALAYINPAFNTSFELKDSRKPATVIGPGEKHPDPSINISSYNNVQEKFNGINTLGTKNKPWLGNDGERSGYYLIKNWRALDPSATASVVFSKANVILMRYGQVLLDLAECKFKTGNLKEAENLLNIIRKRAKLKSIELKDFSDVLLNEYRHELTGEYSLWYVLRRSGIVKDYIKKHFNKTITDGHELLPIPNEQLQVNTALKQNTGY